MLDAFEERSEHMVRHVMDYVDRGTSDIDWIAELSKTNEPITVITQDLGINKKPLERSALKESGLRFVFLASGWSSISYETKAWKLLKAWPKLVEESSRVKLPANLRLTVNGKIQIV